MVSGVPGKPEFLYLVRTRRDDMLQTVNSRAAVTWPNPIAGSGIIAGTTPGQNIQVCRATDERASVNDMSTRYPAEAVAASSDVLSWQDIRLVHLRHSLSELPVPSSDQHCLVLNLSASLHFRARLAKHDFEGEVKAGEVAILPAGTSWSYKSLSTHSSNTVLLYLRPLFVRNAAKEFQLPYEELAVRPEIGFQSQHIRHIALSLLQELTEANVAGRLYADSLAIGLALQFIRRYSSLGDIKTGQGGMAPHRLRKAIGLIDQHLIEEQEGRVGLRLIAKEVGMSYFHFSRSFKQSLGITPTHYIAEQRIEHARRLIQETDLPISEIALRSGFSSQSHFTTSFRRLAGMTPRSFRKGV